MSEPTNTPRTRGFTIIELMITVMIIGVVAALVVPRIAEVKLRNNLSSMVSEIQQLGARVRATAMQTRRAVTMEIRGGRAWANILAGAQCDSDVDQRCVFFSSKASQPEKRVLDLNASIFVNAGARVSAATFMESSPACALSTTVLDPVGSGVALCYSGRGELFVRPGGDTATTCISASATQSNTDWRPSCSAGASGNESDGAVITCNRFDGANAIDVARRIIFPSSGSPYSTVPE